MLRIGAMIAVGLVLVLGAIVWQKSQVTTPASSFAPEAGVKKVDLSSGPEWVQNLAVVAKKGYSANGLENVTISLKGLPKGMVATVSYVMQYQTTNRGTQGALSTKALDIDGATTFKKTVDLGACSAKSCVRHDGVTSVDLELDFTATSGQTASWSKNLDLE